MVTEEKQAKPLALDVRGYTCQVFSDAPVAWALHKETHLITWRDESSGLRVDRFDARNLLDDASAFRRLKRRAVASQTPKNTAELHRLRYGDYAVLYPQEELHEDVQDETETVEAAQEPAFEPPWAVPGTIDCLPSTAQAHEVLVATARKVAAHPQLEVMLRVKQSENPAFSFLTPSHELHAYYCFLRDHKPYEPCTEDQDQTRPLSMAKPAVGLLGEEYAEESDSDQEQQEKSEHQRKQAVRLERAKRLAGHFQQAAQREEKSPKPRPEAVSNTKRDRLSSADGSPSLKKHQT